MDSLPLVHIRLGKLLEACFLNPLILTLLYGAKYVGFGTKENFPSCSNRVRFISDPTVHSDQCDITRFPWLPGPANSGK